MRRLSERLTYSNVVSTLALCLVLGGGTAYAVTQIDPNSVESRHIVDGEVEGRDLANFAVDGRALDNWPTGSLTNTGTPDVKSACGPADPMVPTGQTKRLYFNHPTFSNG